MDKPTNNTRKEVRRLLTRLVRWAARGFGLMACAAYILLFISSRLNLSTYPPTTADLILFTLFATSIIAYVAAWRWPRPGGAVMLVSAVLFISQFLNTQLRYLSALPDVLVSIFIFSGPFIFIGLLFITEGFLRDREGEAAMSTPLVKTDALTFRQALQRIGLLVLPFFILIGITGLASSVGWRPLSQGEMFNTTVYSYRQWQSTGFYLNPGDYVTIRASGEWSYSPVVGWHSPEGGEPAPSYYPMPLARGGALIGKIGENGNEFEVGWRHDFYVQTTGLLFLRINDDKLGDNLGKLDIEVVIVAPTATPK